MTLPIRLANQTSASGECLAYIASFNAYFETITNLYLANIWVDGTYKEYLDLEMIYWKLHVTCTYPLHVPSTNIREV